MGGQQFGTGTLHIDTRGLERVLDFDPDRGIVEVEAGIQWPALIEAVHRLQGKEIPWSIAQKQTGADRLCLGGSLSANAHGRALTLGPIVQDIESFRLIDPSGDLRTCSRTENRDLFRLTVGGYGLFGIVYSIRLRLARRRRLERLVEVRSAEGLDRAFAERIEEGFLFGDFQFETAASSPDFLTRGVFSCYRPTAPDRPSPTARRRLRRRDWRRLLHLAHFDKARAFEEYAHYYLSTSGQLYWSDTHQLSYYADDYHAALDRQSRAVVPGSEMISEVYVPRPEIGEFLGDLAESFRRFEADVIYGTVRLIERDPESFLAWAREPFACVVVNLHVEHSPAGIERAKRHFRLLIDLAQRRGGTYFLTYHRWATQQQVESCYPLLPQFLRLKLEQDPRELFQSDWYRHYKAMFSASV
jgi:FAD/FMN-containing dehydrogenase